MSSFIVQSAIAIVASYTLISIANWPFRQKTKKDVQIRNLVAAMVDFHKAQCYFASTIQITGFILYHQTQKSIIDATDRKSIADFGYNIYDGGILLYLATWALLPISLTLSCIARYGRQSWYLINLSLVTITLGTATLASSMKFGDDLIHASDLIRSPRDYLGSSKCSTASPPTEILKSLCGSDYATYVSQSGIYMMRWVWCIWLFSFLALLFCVISKVARKFRSTSPRRKILKRIFDEAVNHTAVITIVVVLWRVCFGVHFYLFYWLFEHHAISFTWSFGQIIAVTVWVPSLVEFAYIEYSRS